MRLQVFLLVMIELMVLMFFTPPLLAQVPGPLEPTRPGEEFAPPLEPRASPAPSVPLTREQLAPEQADKISLVLSAVRIEGAKALQADQLSDIWKSHLGNRVSLSVLFDIVNAITRRYADAGYALSIAVLPEQRIDDGIVTIRIVEGYVDEIKFSGEPLTNFSGNESDALERFLNKFAAGIIASRPLRTADLERYLLLMNDLPGITARATFAASRTVPGASTMTINISRKPVEGQAGFNNHMVRNLGRTRFGGSVSLNGQLNGGDRLRAEAWRSVHGDAYTYAAIDYSQMVGAEGMKLGASMLYSNSEPNEGLLANLDYIGRQVALAFSAEYPLIRTRAENLFVGADFGVSNARSEVLAVPLSKDRIRTVGGHATYDVADRTGAVSLVRAGVTQGLDILGATQDADPLRSRANGSATFTKLDLRALRNQPLVGALSLYLQINAQAALNDPLLSAAECSYGGRDIGRGYDSGALSGDHCLMGSAELRWSQRVRDRLGMQLYGFADSGVVRQKGVLQPGEERERRAASWGLGARLLFAETLIGNLEVAKPVTASYAEDGRAKARIFASLMARF